MLGGVGGGCLRTNGCFAPIVLKKSAN